MERDGRRQDGLGEETRKYVRKYRGEEEEERNITESKRRRGRELRRQERLGEETRKYVNK